MMGLVEVTAEKRGVMDCFVSEPESLFVTVRLDAGK